MRNEMPLTDIHGRIPLAEQTSLHQRYSVFHPVRCDGGTIVYAGFDYVARQPVTILEFYPEGIAARTQESSVISPAERECGALYFTSMEAFCRQYTKLLQTIGSPNVLSIFDAFFENGTAYAVAEDAEEVTLAEYLSLVRRRLTDGELVYIVRALADALLVVHSCNLLHHGITERTILLGTDGTVKLIDFAAGLATVQRGHAVRDDEPWQDIRTLGETLHRAYTGTGHSVVPMYMDETMPRAISTLFAGMLSDSAPQRFATVFDLRYTVDSLDIPAVRPDVSPAHMEACRARNERMDAQATDPPEQRDTVEPKNTARPEASGRDKNGKLAVAIGIVLLLLSGILVWVLLRW